MSSDSRTPAAGALAVLAPLVTALLVAASSSACSKQPPGFHVTGTQPPGPAQAKPHAEAPVEVPPPTLSKHRYVFPVKACKVSYARRLLVYPKSVIWAAKDCEFVAPLDGRVDEVNRDDRWAKATDRGEDREGKFVSIIGADGVRYLGGHLDAVADGLKPGDKVKAGQTLGRVGNSGNAREQAPGLYFAISWPADGKLWWVRRGMVEPWDYLDAWKEGNPTASPREQMLKLRKDLGAEPSCKVACAPARPGPPAPTLRPPAA